MNTPVPGHSAAVRIHLWVNGAVMPVAQLGPTFLILRTPVDHPACDAEITLCIDGHESRWVVWLPNGIQVECRETAISAHAAGKGERQLQIGHGGQGDPGGHTRSLGGSLGKRTMD